MVKIISMGRVDISNKFEKGQGLGNTGVKVMDGETKGTAGSLGQGYMCQ